MDHEVFVPVAAESLRQTLRDPARVAHCVPAFQQVADDPAGALTGRLKVRAAGHTITYRGTLGVTEEDGVFTVRAEGVEVRGSGSVTVTLDVRLTASEDETAPGTTLGFTGVARVEGRLADLPADAAAQAAHRLLDRFAARLADACGAPKNVRPGRPQSADEAAAPLPPRAPKPTSPPGTGKPTGPATEPAAGEELEEGAHDERDRTPDDETVAGEGDFRIPDSPEDLDDDEPPAEAAHARRTMIGRSAEEVDHAPPRGRYAPVPLPEAVGTAGVLRWVAPAAALALASAVVVTRVLRRRR